MASSRVYRGGTACRTRSRRSLGRRESGWSDHLVALDHRHARDAKRPLRAPLDLLLGRGRHPRRGRSHRRRGQVLRGRPPDLVRAQVQLDAMRAVGQHLMLEALGLHHAGPPGQPSDRSIKGCDVDHHRRQLDTERTNSQRAGASLPAASRFRLVFCDHGQEPDSTFAARVPNRRRLRSIARHPKDRTQPDQVRRLRHEEVAPSFARQVSIAH